MRFCPWASEPMEELSPLPLLANIVIMYVLKRGAAVLAPSTPAYIYINTYRQSKPWYTYICSSVLCEQIRIKIIQKFYLMVY